MTSELTHFSSLNLGDDLAKALAELKFDTPTPVQAETIPHLMAGKDVIAKAQTGTGKTAAFALPILAKLDLRSFKTQALILAPTRELAIQVADQVMALSKFMKGIEVAVLCGGQEYRKQLTQLKRGAHIVVGTPGRILDHIERKTLNLGELSTFVLDEADEMLRMGFIDDVESILKQLPGNKQMAMFSATMPSRIREISGKYLREAVSVDIKSATATVVSIEQKFLFSSQGEKPAALLRLLAAETYQGVIVFVRTKAGADEVASMLQSQQHKAVAIHGDLNQPLRERIIDQFRQGQIDILVATDVAARGLDIEQVTHVINYDIPFDCETYVHRIGRTGRAGRSGVAILFITPKESRMLNIIERHTKQPITKIQVPSNEMIQEVRKTRFLKTISEKMEHSGMASYRTLLTPFIEENNYDVLDVAAALALMFNNNNAWGKPLSLPAVAKRADSPKDRSRGDSSFAKRGGDRRDGPFSRARGDRRDSPPFARDRNDRPSGDRRDAGARFEGEAVLYRLDVGRLHGVKPGNIVGAIANEAGLNSRNITGITIHDDHSTVFLPKAMPQDAIRSLQKAWVCGRQLGVSLVG